MRCLLLIVLLALAAAACGSSDDPETTASPTTTEAATSTTSEAAATTTPETAPPSTTAEAVDTRTLLAEWGVGAVTLHAADEGGSHPLLSWDPVEAAASYWLVVRDGDGNAYWGWTGDATEVRFGGGSRADTNQTAVLFEPMTWSVAALGADGELVAVSPSQPIAP